MLAMMAGATELLLVTFAKGEQRVLEQAQAHAILDAAVARAAIGISDDRPNKRWRVDGTPMKFVFDGVPITISVQDQLGLIDLNAADGSMITRLLESQGLADKDAQILTDRILDWRSTTGLKSLHGTPDSQYTAIGNPYRPRHGPFQMVSELQLVLGITPALYKKIAPALTVYSNRPAFEPSLAPVTVLKALYLNNPDQVAAVLQARTGATSMLAAGQSLAGRSYAVKASLALNGDHYQRTTVIELTGDDRHPYLTLFWR